MKISEKLHVCNVHKIGLLLNLSVFYFENQLQPGKAILLSMKTLNEALSKISEVNQKDHKEVSTLL
jgi:hypothetical protein